MEGPMLIGDGITFIISTDIFLVAFFSLSTREEDAIHPLGVTEGSDGSLGAGEANASPSFFLVTTFF